MRMTAVCTLVCACLLLGNGCEKSGNTGSPNGNRKKPDSNSPIAAIHWLGMDRIAKQTNATGFLRIWRLPESERLKSQTLDKLALAPWRLGGTNPPAAVTNYAPLLRSNHSASLVRPLLDDLVKDEWYLEIREAKPGSAQMALAVRLNPKSAAEWDTNLQALFGTMPGARRTPTQSAATGSGWQIQLTNASATIPPYLRHVEFMHAGPWTILGLAPDQNVVLADVVSRVQRAQAPFTPAATTDWVETKVDLRRLSTAFSWDWELPQAWPGVEFTVNGDGTNILTTGKLHFSRPLAFEIEPWNIPTNLIHEPLHSFVAIQGIKPLLSSIKWWQDLRAPQTPNQAFFWAQTGLPFVDYAAAPLPDVNGTMTQLGKGIMNSMNPLLASNRMGKWERSADSDGVTWTKAPIISPFIHSTRLNQGSFMFAGLSSLLVASTPPPTATLQSLLNQKQTVYFDREITGPRIEAWMYLGQLLRLIFRREQLPSDAKSVLWLRAAGPLIGNTSTIAMKTGSSEISFSRTSTVGFTAAELHILADWLESGRFPCSFYSELAKLPPLPAPHTGSALPQVTH